MANEIPNTDDISRRLAAAELQIERSKVVMESLAGFCHAHGQPATVLLSSIELLKMQNGQTDPEMQKQILDICYDAIIEIRDLLAQMKKNANGSRNPICPATRRRTACSPSRSGTSRRQA